MWSLTVHIELATVCKDGYTRVSRVLSEDDDWNVAGKSFGV